MSAAKTAKMLNGLLDSQKADRTRIQQLEARLAAADTRQAAAVAVAMSAAKEQHASELGRVQQELTAQNTALTALVVHKDGQITTLTQELSGVRQVLAAADASNVELNAIIETLGDNLDKATQATAHLANERAEVAQQREALNHLLDEVREHMRKKDYDRERAILNRKVLSGGAPAVNRR